MIPVITCINLSNPKPNPPLGTPPYFLNSKYQDKDSFSAPDGSFRFRADSKTSKFDSLRLPPHNSPIDGTSKSTAAT